MTPELINMILLTNLEGFIKWKHIWPKDVGLDWAWVYIVRSTQKANNGIFSLDQAKPKRYFFYQPFVLGKAKNNYLQAI